MQPMCSQHAVCKYTCGLGTSTLPGVVRQYGACVYSDLDLDRAPYGLYGVKYIDLVSLAPVPPNISNFRLYEVVSLHSEFFHKMEISVGKGLLVRSAARRSIFIDFQTIPQSFCRCLRFNGHSGEMQRRTCAHTSMSMHCSPSWRRCWARWGVFGVLGVGCVFASCGVWRAWRRCVTAMLASCAASFLCHCRPPPDQCFPIAHCQPNGWDQEEYDNHQSNDGATAAVFLAAVGIKLYRAVS